MNSVFRCFPSWELTQTWIMFKIFARSLSMICSASTKHVDIVSEWLPCKLLRKNRSASFWKYNINKKFPFRVQLEWSPSLEKFVHGNAGNVSWNPTILQNPCYHFKQRQNRGKEEKDRNKKENEEVRKCTCSVTILAFLQNVHLRERCQRCKNYLCLVTRVCVCVCVCVRARAR
jgi:hypothetical protein